MLIKSQLSAREAQDQLTRCAALRSCRRLTLLRRVRVVGMSRRGPRVVVHESCTGGISDVAAGFVLAQPFDTVAKHLH